MDINTVEMAVLGCIFLKPEYALSKILNNLETNDFQNITHRLIFDTIKKCDNEKKAISPITISAELQLKGIDVKASALDMFSSGIFSLEYELDTYMSQVKENSERKYLIEQSGEILHELQSDGELIELRARLADLGIKNICYDNVEMPELMDIIAPEVSQGRRIGLLTGFEMFDKTTKGFHKQNLIVIASGAGKGKTALTLSMVLNMILAGKSVLYYTLEMSKEEIGKRLLQMYCGISSDRTDRKLEAEGYDPFWDNTDNVDQRKEFMNKMREFLFVINDSTHKLNKILSGIKSTNIEKIKIKKPLDLVVIDYLQLIESVNLKDGRERQISDIVYKLKWLAMDLNIPIIAICQTNREAERIEIDKSGREKRIGRNYELRDLRESGTLEQAADMVIFLNRWKKPTDKDSPQEQLDFNYNMDIKKHRHGKVFDVALVYIAEITKFEEANNG